MTQPLFEALLDSWDRNIRSVIIFYGTGSADYSNSRAAYQGHFAEDDEFEPESNVDNLEEFLRRVGRPVTFYRYPGNGHTVQPAIAADRLSKRFWGGCNG